MSTITIERCAACGFSAKVNDDGTGGHPIVAVMSQTDADAINAQATGEASQRGFVQVPICRDCHVEPEHRVWPIKGHFFERKHAAAATAAAGSNQIGGSGI